MSDILVIDKGDADESHDLQKAQEVGETLSRVYPDHPWMVTFQGRALIVRHMMISQAVRLKCNQDGFGFVLKHLDSFSATQLAHNAMLAGGQLLEAFGFPRGRWDGRDAEVPASWMHNEQRFQ